MEPRRFSGKTVEEATDNALEALGVNLEDVEIVVVNPGRSGILGFGGEPAEIDVALLGGGGVDAPPAPAAASDEDARCHPDDESDADEDDDYEDEEDDEELIPDVEDEDEDDSESSDVVESEEPASPPAPRSTEARERSGPPERGGEPDPEVIEFASEVIDYFLASMNVVADTYIRDESDDGVPIFDIEGEDSGLLIGRRGETLQSLQYLVNLIVTHQLGRSAYVQIDIEGYKERRRETLAGIARRAADRVVDSGRSTDLEPMPAFERRWVHMALANNTEVTTESSGEGSNRFVVIYPAGGNSDGGAPGGRRPRGRGGRRRRR